MAFRMITMAIAATMVSAAVLPASAMAQDRSWNDGAYHHRQDDNRGWGHNQGRDNNWRDGNRWDGRGSYPQQQWNGGRYNDRSYYDQSAYRRGYNDRPTYRYRCQGSGTTGTIVGALAGGLLGNGLAGHGDKTLGTILGGGAGALAGRAIDRSSSHC